MKLAFVNTKGGVGKTTSAVFLATALSSHGRTLLVDCDPQKSALLWTEGVDTPYTVVGLPVNDVHKRLAAAADGYEHVVLDTPPGYPAIIKSAVLAADTVLVPLSPTGVDVVRLAPTLELLVELEQVSPVGVGVLLTKMRYGTTSARGIREELERRDYPVMATEIPLSEVYAQGSGQVPVDLGRYEELVKELFS